jgi:beta-glucosidase
VSIKKPSVFFCRNIFADYAEFCFKTYGDRIQNWFTFNEPRIVAALGFDTGTNPPNRCTKCAAGGNSATEPYTVVHNILLSHATAVARYRNKYQVSNTVVCTYTKIRPICDI